MRARYMVLVSISSSSPDKSIPLIIIFPLNENDFLENSNRKSLRSLAPNGQNFATCSKTICEQPKCLFHSSIPQGNPLPLKLFLISQSPITFEPDYAF